MALAGVGGGVAWSHSVGTGRLYHKSVSVLDERRGRRYAFSVAILLYADSSQRVIGEVVEEFANAYKPPRTLRISPELHERLTERFEEVDYLLTFEENGRIGGRVPRSNFNRGSLGDEVELLAYDWLDVNANNRVVGVTDREPPSPTRTSPPIRSQRHTWSDPDGTALDHRSSNVSRHQTPAQWCLLNSSSVCSSVRSTR